MKRERADKADGERNGFRDWLPIMLRSYGAGRKREDAVLSCLQMLRHAAQSAEKKISFGFKGCGRVGIWDAELS